MLLLKEILGRVWPYIVVFVVTLLAGLYFYFEFQKNLQQHYDQGVEAGRTALKGEYEIKAEYLRQQLSKDKEEFERNAQAKLEASQADAALARDSADRLRRTLSEIRGIASNTGISFPSGASTTEAVKLLADMLEESNRAYIETADFADRAFDAGKTCELQYDTLRKRIDEAKSNDKRANTSSSQIDTSSTRIRDVP